MIKSLRISFRVALFTALSAVVATTAASGKTEHSEPPVKAPFAKGEDSLCTNDWWNRPDNPIIDLKVPRDEVVSFGIYTVSEQILKLTAQLYPLYPDEIREVRFEIAEGDEWKEIARQEVTFECWPRFADVTQPGASQFTGWPKTISLIYPPETDS